MSEEKKDNSNGPLPPLPGNLPILPQHIPDLPQDIQNEPSLEFNTVLSPQNTSLVTANTDYEMKFQGMEQTRNNLVKMLEEIQKNHEIERQMWEEKATFLNRDSQSLLDEFATRQLKEEEERAKRDAEMHTEKLKLEMSLKELETKLEEAREKVFLQALKSKEEEVTTMKLETAMKDVQLKNIRANAEREIEAIKIKMEANLSEKVLSLQKQYEEKLTDVYFKSSQKEKDLTGKIENLQSEKEALIKHAEFEKDRLTREYADKMIKKQNEINLLTSKIEHEKENFSKNISALQNELTSAKAKLLLDVANIKSEYENKLNQAKTMLPTLEGKIETMSSQIESEKKIASEKMKFKDDEIAALRKQFAEREELLKTEFEKQSVQNVNDKNRIEAELRRNVERIGEEYNQKINIIQNEK
ncbi:MAG TPA: hypothetical protein DCP53_05810, partial [Elusimicrobia bacterium]|nr:hypothetical protein [Elusimicrobiota bacterium]